MTVAESRHLNPDIENPDIDNPDIENPDIENPDIENPDIANGALSDTTWFMTNKGNAAGVVHGQAWRSTRAARRASRAS